MAQNRKPKYLRSWIHWWFSVHRHQIGPGRTTRIMSDSSDCLSSEDEDTDCWDPGEYDPDAVVYDHLPLDDDHFHPNPNDRVHATWSNTPKSLKEFYWMMSAIVTFVSLLVGCYEYVTHSRLSSLTLSWFAIATGLWAVASSPSSTIQSVHQFFTGGATGGGSFRPALPAWTFNEFVPSEPLLFSVLKDIGSKQSRGRRVQSDTDTSTKRHNSCT